jgi:hypothetical protein
MSTTNHHFLENLLLHRIHPKREVPAEGPYPGTRFTIGYRASQQALCIIFHIDKESANKPLSPLPNYQGERPDYLVLHIQSSNCICSIIELKAGRNRQGISKGIEQITNFHKHLTLALDNVFQSFLNIHFQGIILAPFLNDKMQDAEIRKLLRNAPCTINILQSPPKAQLLPYVERKLQRFEKYVEDESLCAKNGDLDLEFLEILLARSFKNQQFINPTLIRKNGINVNFSRPPASLALHADKTGFHIYFEDQQPQSSQLIRQALQKLGLSNQTIDQVLIRKQL